MEVSYTAGIIHTSRGKNALEIKLSIIELIKKRNLVLVVNKMIIVDLYLVHISTSLDGEYIQKSLD